MIKPTHVDIDSEAMFEFGTLSPDDIIKIKNIDKENKMKRTLINNRQEIYNNKAYHNRFNVLSEQELIDDNINEANDICNKVIEMEDEMRNDMIFSDNFVPRGDEQPSMIINNMDSNDSSIKRSRAGSKTSSHESKIAKKDNSQISC